MSLRTGLERHEPVNRLDDYLSVSVAVAVPAFCATDLQRDGGPGFPLMIHS